MRMREAASAATRIGTTKRGIGPAYEDKVGRRAIRVMDLADLPALAAKIERLLAHHNALRRGLGLRRARAAQAIYDELAAVAPQGAALYGFGLVAARRQAARGQAHPVRGRAGRAARHRPRHLSVRDLVQHGGGAGGDRLRARARARSATCSASARPTRRGWARGRSRPSRTTRSAGCWASAAANSAP